MLSKGILCATFADMFREVQDEVKSEVTVGITRNVPLNVSSPSLNRRNYKKTKSHLLSSGDELRHYITQFKCCIVCV